MKRTALRASFVAVFIALGCAIAAWACSPATIAAAPSDDGGTSSALTKACSDYGFAYCTQLQTCSATTVELRFKDFTTCQTIYTAVCEGTSTAPSSSETAETKEACVAVLPSWTCSDFLNSRNGPPACALMPGQLPNGAACSNRQQCQSEYCGTAEGAACGTCMPVVTVGDSCAVTACQEGLLCEGVGSTCVAPAGLGSPCNGNQACADGLNCPASTGICVQGETAPGAPCVYNGAACDSYAGVSCNAQTSTCQTTVLVQPGGGCGTIGNQATSCVAGACVRGQCVGDVGYQQPCDIDGGADCLPATHCIVRDGGTQGTCEVYGTIKCQ